MRILILSVLLTYMLFLKKVQGQSCLEPTDIPFGTVTCTGSNHRSSCDIACKNDNYKASISSIYCYQGIWHDYKRIRTEGRSEGTKVKLSDLRCQIERLVDESSSSRMYESSELSKPETCAIMKCPQDYRGITESQCEKLGCCWNGEARSCHAKLCSKPRDYQGISKSFCENGVKKGPYCRHNRETAECYQAKRRLNTCPKGTANPPSCQAITCPSLPNVANSDTVDCTSGQTFGSTCTVTCKKGYGSVNSLSATCGGDGSSLSGTWSSMPTCTRLPCIEVTSISNGGIRCLRRNNGGSTCTISCEDTFEASVKSIYCNGADGKWYDYSRIRNEGISASTRLSVADLKCAKEASPSASGRMLTGQRTVSTADQCSGRIAQQKCHVSYNGQTEQQCARVGCCWNAQTSSCQAKLCPSPKNYPGISKSACESVRQGQPKCQYNKVASECILAVQQTMRGEPTQNVVKIPETYSWRANLMDGTSSGSVGYQVTTSRRAAAGSAAEERNLVSVTEPFRSDDSFWNLYRKTACHHAGVVKVDTADRDEIKITLTYNNDWDLFHTFAMSNRKSTSPNDMLITVNHPTSFIQIKFTGHVNRNVKERRVLRSFKPNDFLNSGLKTITLTLTRANSSLQYSVALRDRVVEGKYRVPNLFGAAEELYLYINRSSDYKRRPVNDPKRGFGLCKVDVDAS